MHVLAKIFYSLGQFVGFIIALPCTIVINFFDGMLHYADKHTKVVEDDDES